MRKTMRWGMIRWGSVTEVKSGSPSSHMIESIVQALLGGDRSPSAGVSAARTTWVMDQALAGIK